MSYSNTPNTGDTLGSTRVPINTNFSLIQDAMSQDHFGMGTGVGIAGTHKVIHMVMQNVLTPGIFNTDATQTGIYTKQATTGNLFARSPNHVDPLPAGEYQLTTFSDADIPSFGTIITTGLPGHKRSSGWTFLPGGLVLQYGSADLDGSPITISYPVTINTALFPAIITLGGFIVNPTPGFSIATNTNTGFKLTYTNGGSTLYWMSIGKV